MKILLTLLLFLFYTFILFGCGQSGALYLPADPQRLDDLSPPSSQDLF